MGALHLSPYIVYIPGFLHAIIYRERERPGFEATMSIVTGLRHKFMKEQCLYIRGYNN